MKKHRLPYMVAGAVLFAALFTGCTNERLEDELDFRKIGINSMQSGDYEGAKNIPFFSCKSFIY